MRTQNPFKRQVLPSTDWASLAVQFTQMALSPPPDTSRYTIEQATSLLASCLPCQYAEQQEAEQRLALEDTPPEAQEDPEDGPEGDGGDDLAPVLHWRGVVGAEGRITGDGRMIETNALRWEESSFPQPLRYLPVDEGFGHAGAVVVGRIMGYERLASGLIEGYGDYDLAIEMGREAARQAGTGQTSGASVDLDDVSFDIRVAADVLQEEQQIMEEGPADAADDNPTDDEGRVTVIQMDSDDELFVITSARVRATTQAPIAAFAETKISLEEDNWEEILEQAAQYYSEHSRPSSLVASAAALAEIPVDPPAAWFTNPQLTKPTPITITEEGRVFGHLAAWGTCHTGNPAGPSQCITPPSSPSNYSRFLTGGLLTAEGIEVAVGQITMDTLHAEGHLTAAAAIRHYESTGLAMADITIGNDGFGIWFSGALRPGVTPAQRRVLRASPLSGDWRRFQGPRSPLDLVAALAVNVQGYPIPRPHGLVASGVMVSLVASGMVAPKQVIPPGQPGSLSTDDLLYLKRLAAKERANDQASRGEAAGLVRRMAAIGLMNRIRQSRSGVLQETEQRSA